MHSCDTPFSSSFLRLRLAGVRGEVAEREVFLPFDPRLPFVPLFLLVTAGVGVEGTSAGADVDAAGTGPLGIETDVGTAGEGAVC